MCFHRSWSCFLLPKNKKTFWSSFYDLRVPAFSTHTQKKESLIFYFILYYIIFLMREKKKSHYSLGQRAGFKPDFCIPRPDSWAKTHDLDSARLLNRFFSRGWDLPLSGPTVSVKPNQKGSFFKQAPNSTSSPRLNMKSQKSLLFKSPQSHPNKKKKSHFSILKPRNNQTNGGDFRSNKK